MQALAGVADFRGQQRLDVHVDILVVGGKRNLARLDLRQKLRQPLLDFLVVLRRENAAVAEHLRVRHGAGDVLLVKSLVKGNRGVEVVDQLVGLFLKASCPKFHSLFLAKQPARPGRLSGISFVFTLYCSSGAAALPTEQIRVFSAREMFRREKARKAKAYRVYSEPPATHCRRNRSAQIRVCRISAGTVPSWEDPRC